MRRLKELERENARLRKLVANQALDNAMLKDLVGGTSGSAGMPEPWGVEVSTH